MYCGLSVETSHVKDRGRILFVFSSTCVVGKNLNTPIGAPWADNTITWGGIGVLGSPFYICGLYTLQRRGDPFVMLHIKRGGWRFQIKLSC